MQRKTILLFSDWFEPGYKAGGPIRSCVNFVRHMQHDYDVYVFTSDRDLNSSVAYADIPTDSWIAYDQRVKVYYCSPENLTWRRITQLLEELQPDFIYVNSLFSKHFTIYPLLINKRAGWKSKVILAPRGMLRASALRFKTFKKKVYLATFKLLSMHKHIFFQATDETEYNDIKKHFGKPISVLLAPNFPGYIHSYPGTIFKRPGELSIIFVGRLHPIKNLDFLLERLPQVKGEVSLTIVGSEESKTFTEHCKNIARPFSGSIKVNFKGEIPNDKLPAIIAEHHIFSLPTKGENFGHAIFEAFAQGKPVLISDQTPWRNLQPIKAGWDLPLQEPTQFVNALQRAIDFDQGEYAAWSKASWQYIHEFVNNNNLKTTYHNLFN